MEGLNSAPPERRIPGTLVGVGLILILGGNFVRYWLAFVWPYAKELGDGFNICGWTCIGVGVVLYFVFLYYLTEEKRLSTVPALEEEIRKLERRKQEHEDTIANLPRDHEYDRRRKQLKTYIYEMDLRVIELKTKLTTLAHAESPDPGVPSADLLHLDEGMLTDMKNKRRLVTDLKAPAPPPKQLTPEQELEEARAKYKRDEAARDQRLREIGGGKSFDELTPDKQAQYMEEDQDFEDVLRTDRERIRKFMTR